MGRIRYNGREYDSGREYKGVVRPVLIEGNRTSVTTINDIWPNGTANNGNLTPQAAAGVTLAISSGSANDAAAGTGARTVVIQCVDSAGIERLIPLTLNGTTAVNDASGYKIQFVNKAWVNTFGSGLANAGKIYIFDSTDTVSSGENATIAKRLSIIDTGNNVARTGYYMVPMIGNPNAVAGTQAAAGGDACDLLLIALSGNVNDATTTIKYVDFNGLFNLLLENDYTFGQANQLTYTLKNFGQVSSGVDLDWPPPQVMEPMVILTGGVIRFQATASVAAAISVGIQAWGLLVAQANLGITAQGAP